MKFYFTFLFVFVFQVLFACHGTGISLQSYQDNPDGTSTATVEICIGFSSNFGATDNFSLGFYDGSGNPVAVTSIISGSMPSYSYEIFAGGLCAGSGNNNYVAEYNVNASATGVASGNTVSFTNTSSYGSPTGSYGNFANNGSYQGTSTSPTCSPSAPTDTPSYIPSAGDLATDNDCTGCVVGFGEIGGNSAAVEQYCFLLEVQLASSISTGFIVGESGFEGDGASNCNGSVAPGPVTSNNDTQESCTNTDGGPCDQDGTTNGTAVLFVPNAIVAPVEFGKFEISFSSEKRINTLNWSTYSEINSDYFSVEYSSDGKNFEGIATIVAAGTSFEENWYTYQHKTLNSTEHYYRIKQIDFDGSFMYSEIRHITTSRNNSSQASLRISPNPVNNETRIALTNISTTNTSFNLEIVDLQGKLMVQKKINQISGNINELIELSHLSNGLYLVKVYNDEISYSSMLMKN